MTIGTCSTETCHLVCHWDVNLYTGATPLCAEVAGRARNPEWHMTWKQRRTQDDPKRFFSFKISTPQCRYVYIYIYICIHTLIPFRAFLAGPCFGFWTRFFLLFWALTTSVHTLHMPKPVLAAAHSTERISRRLFQRSKGPGYICIYMVYHAIQPLPVVFLSYPFLT